MLVSLIGYDKLLTTTLPEVPEGVYWVKGNNEKKLVSIESKVNEWYVTSNKSARLVNSQAVVFKDGK